MKKLIKILKQTNEIILSSSCGCSQKMMKNMFPINDEIN
jgi:hypothetical protein